MFYVKGKIVRYECDFTNWKSHLIRADGYVEQNYDLTNTKYTVNFVTGYYSNFEYLGFSTTGLASTGTYLRISDVTDENDPIVLFEWRK